MKTVLFLFDEVGLDKPKSSIEFTKKTDQMMTGAEVVWSGLASLEYTVSTDRIAIFDPINRRDLKDYDLVYFRSWAGSKAFAGICAFYLETHGVRYFDSEASTRRSFSKLDQYFKLQHGGLPVPTTVQGSAEFMLSQAGQGDLSYPVIIKTDAGGRKGLDNHLAKDPEEAKKILSTPPEDGQYLLQQFIDNDCDYRVLIFGDEPKLIIKRTGDRSKTHVNNTSQGAKADLVPLEEFDRQILNECLKAAKILRREIAGVDVVIEKGTDKHYFLEVNRKPQLGDGTFVDEKMKIFTEFLAKNF